MSANSSNDCCGERVTRASMHRVGSFNMCHSTIRHPSNQSPADLPTDGDELIRFNNQIKNQPKPDSSPHPSHHPKKQERQKEKKITKKKLTSLHPDKNPPVQKRRPVNHARHKTASQQAIVAVILHHRLQSPSSGKYAWLGGRRRRCCLYYCCCCCCCCIVGILLSSQ
jgi:hypothetical protein